MEFLNLPIRVDIFSYFSLKETVRLERVCRKWIGKLPYFIFKYIDNCYSNHRKQDHSDLDCLSIFQSILRRVKSNVKEIKWSGSCFDDSNLETLELRFKMILSSDCPKLESLDFSRFINNSPDILNLINALPHIKNLKLSTDKNKSAISSKIGVSGWKLVQSS